MPAKGHNYGICKLCGKDHGVCPVKGMIGWTKGKTKETDERLRKKAEAQKQYYKEHGSPCSFKGHNRGPETCKKCGKIHGLPPGIGHNFKTMTGHNWGPKDCKKCGKNHGSPPITRHPPMIRTKEWCENISGGLKGIKFSDEWKKNLGISNRMHRLEERVKTGIKMKQMWADPNSVFHTKEFIMKKALKPNNLEKDFHNHFTQLNYTGDFAFFIGRMNPDFIDSRSNKCIDIFGDYYHPDTTEEEKRINYFKEHGYNLLVIWESNWNINKNDEILRVKNFLGELD